MKRIVAKVLSVCVLGVNSVNAVPNCSGPFLGIIGGGAHLKFNEHFRADDVKKENQIKLVDRSGNAFYVGVEVGYGYEARCGLYVGGKIRGMYNNAEIKDDKKLQGELPVGVLTAVSECDYLRAKPQFSYGAAFVLGGKIVPNVLVYAQFGIEGTYWEISQRIVAWHEESGAVVAIVNDADTSIAERSLNGTRVSAKALDGGKIKQTVFSVVPGVGVKYYFNGGLYVGADCEVSVGMFKKIDDKYFTTAGSVSMNDGSSTATGTMPSLNEEGDLYLGRNVSFRYGLTVGYKF